MTGALLNLEAFVTKSAATRHTSLPVVGAQFELVNPETAKIPKTNDANAAFAEQNSLPTTSFMLRPDGVAEERIMEGTAKSADASMKMSQKFVRGIDPS